MATARPGSGPATQPGATALAATAALAALCTAWAGFQWRQLAVARRGGEPFCALGAGDACAELGDSGFALGVESLSGMPVAGWGVVWALVALLLPLLALRRLRAGRPTEPLWSATALTAAAGVAGVALLIGVSVRVGTLCSNCLLTYVGVFAYAALVLGRAHSAPPRRLSAGAAWAGGGAAAAFAVLLPVAAITPPADDPALAGLLEPSAPAADGADDAASVLMRRVASLSARHRQLLSDAHAMYVHPAHEVPMRRPRALLGSPMAPVRITHFSDPLCSHCADLHEELERLLAAAAPNSVAIESRVFPLHASCNPHLPHTGGPALRCLASRVLICLEDHPEAFSIRGRVLAAQRELTRDRLFELTAPYAPRDALERCAASPETGAALAEDIEWAMAHGIEGTPLVLVNGRKIPSFLPFLYALAVTRGDVDHAVFRDLPPPSPGVAAAPGHPPAAAR